MSSRGEECRARALASLSPHLDEPLLLDQALREALTAARGVKEDHRCAETLAVPAPHLDIPRLSSALAAARAIADGAARSKALAAPCLNLTNASCARY